MKIIEITNKALVSYEGSMYTRIEKKIADQPIDHYWKIGSGDFYCSFVDSILKAELEEAYQRLLKSENDPDWEMDF